VVGSYHRPSRTGPAARARRALTSREPRRPPGFGRRPSSASNPPRTAVPASVEPEEHILLLESSTQTLAFARS
jgi:hypothetical protein